MMYGSPANFEREFIQRTKENISILEDSGEHYDVTQFINSMLGLLIIPKERYYNQINDSMINAGLLQQVRSSCNKKDPDLQYIVRKLRNAAAHGHLEFEAEKSPYGKVGQEIKRITFQDDGNFTAKLEIDLLKKFVLAFADAILALQVE